MKQIVLVAMVMMTVASSANATSDWDYFWGTTVSQALDPKLNGWDEFWGTCQHPDKSITECVGTIAAGIGFAIAVPLAIAGVGVAAVSVGPIMTTALPVIQLPAMVLTTSSTA